MRSLDIYSAVVTSVPFLLLAVVAESKMFGPNGDTGRMRRMDAYSDISAVFVLAIAFVTSVIELVRERDDGNARMLAGCGLALGALMVFGHTAHILRQRYRGQDDNRE